MAERSVRAAKEIVDLITATQDENKKALGRMTVEVKDMEAGNKVVSKTGIPFAEILNGVKSISCKLPRLS